MASITENLSELYYSMFKCKVCGVVWSRKFLPKRSPRHTDACPMGCKEKDGSDTGVFQTRRRECQSKL